jgi:hypothetical protein
MFVTVELTVARSARIVSGMTRHIALAAFGIVFLAAGTKAHRAVQSAPAADAILDAYVTAVGGEAALQRITTRIVRGRFDNGRGLKAPYVIYAKVPNKLVTFVGSERADGQEGSGRGYDGQAGWDKNFIGTGLRGVEGVELADLVRDADIHRPLHWRSHCTQRTVDGRVDVAGSAAVVVRCGLAEGRTARLYFDASNGVLVRYDSQMWNGDRFVSIYYEDYRVVDGVRLPFRTRSLLPNATTTFVVESVRHNDPIDDRVFARPTH